MVQSVLLGSLSVCKRFPATAVVLIRIPYSWWYIPGGFLCIHYSLAISASAISAECVHYLS